MSRSGYSDDCENINLYRGSVERAIRGKRGQAFLREMAVALDAMSVKELIAENVVRPDGQACAMGAVALARRIDVSTIDPYDNDQLAERFGIARSLACEIAYENDGDDYYIYRHKNETPAERWIRMRAWVAEQINESRKDDK